MVAPAKFDLLSGVVPATVLRTLESDSPEQQKRE
jgi:hypothetical protein